MSHHASRTHARLSWVVIATLALALVGALAAPPRPALAAAFTPGNFVVYRVGTGATPLINTGNPVFLDEYTPAGVLVQSIAMPTAPSGANKPLIASGIAGSEGGLNRSADGRYLVLAGYAASIPNATSLASTNASVVNRVIGRVDSLGNIDTSTALNNFAAFDNPREVASDDGTRFWGVSGDGSATDPPGLGGVLYATLGATSGTQIAAGPPTNVRSVNIFGGQLYVSSQQGNNVGRGILTVGSGLPTTAGQTMMLIPGHGTSAASPTMRDFVILDLNPAVAGLDTIYSANEYNGLRKYSFNGTTWVPNGVIHPRASTSNQPSVGDQVYRRITAVANGSQVTVYATRYQVLSVVYDPVELEDVIATETNGELVRLVDNTGYNGALSGTPTVLIPAGTNKAIRGVALAPVAPVVSQPDLTVSVSGPAAGVIGTPYSYTLTVANVGTVAASGASVRFTLPAGVTFGSATGTGGFTGVQAGGVVTFSGGSIPAAGAATLTVTVTPTASGTVAVAAGAAVVDPAGTIAEINEANNASTEAVSTTVTAVAQPDLTVSVGAPASAVVGAPYNYTLTVSNIGTAAASGVSVRFGLPAGVTFVSSTNPGDFLSSQAGGVVTFSGGSVAVGSSATLMVRVTPTSVGTVTVAAGAAVADPANTIAETNEANNASTGAASTSVLSSDTTAPDTAITAQPGSETSSTSASFSFTGTDDVTPAGGLTFECSLDGAAFASCSSPASYTGLSVGAHTFQVRATDAAGNTDATPALVSWTVIATPGGTDQMIYLPVVVR